MSTTPQICTRCGSYAQHKTTTHGKLSTELILWCLLLLPGLLYTTWRLTTRAERCTQCGSPDLVPITTPTGRELHKKYHSRR
ncbi:hypothetical protein QEH52_01605 [Coraliomargarita sp. SDUM461003]|uniref:LITAF domain-containing protein n=1 Tax=Thalassobacterium maritimum TaxID=3041265 RepID=A0ABU1APT5_9BACT|nr:hypothetical protein [Coraliomargarita sp. SDUM461003]MDQ8206187.1 hypothetical protein [Coraliomargarita sp. SDUM461003]